MIRCTACRGFLLLFAMTAMVGHVFDARAGATQSDLKSTPMQGPKDGRELPPTDLERVKPGGLAPDFTLEDADSRPVNLADFHAKKRVLVIFYRGYW